MTMRRFVLFSIFLALLSPAASANVLKVVIHDTIQAETAERIERALDQAAAQKS